MNVTFTEKHKNTPFVYSNVKEISFVTQKNFEGRKKELIRILYNEDSIAFLPKIDYKITYINE